MPDLEIFNMFIIASYLSYLSPESNNFINNYIIPFSIISFSYSVGICSESDEIGEINPDLIYIKGIEFIRCIIWSMKSV